MFLIEEYTVFHYIKCLRKWTFAAYFIAGDLWPWLLTYGIINICFHCIYVSSLVLIDECLGKKWTFGTYFTTSPQLTFDLGRWPLTSTTCAVFRDSSMTQVWFQLVNVWERNGHLEHILQLHLSWPLTSVGDLWPHQHVRLSVIHLRLKFGSNWLKVHDMIRFFLR